MPFCFYTAFMKRLRAGEWALLLLPCVALGGFAWWQKGRKPLKTSDLLSPIVEQAQLVPVSPRDVYDGYDTKFVLKAKPPPAFPAYVAVSSNFSQTDLTGTTLHFRQNGRDIVLPTSNRKLFQRTLSNGDSTTTTLRMRLRDLPTSSAATVLRGKVVTTHFAQITTNGVTRNVNRTSRVVPISVVVRPANQRVKLPEVSRFRPFVLESIKAKTGDIFDGAGQIIADTTVNVIFRFTDSAHSDVVPFLDNVRVTDEHGKKYQSFVTSVTRVPASIMWSGISAQDSTDGKCGQQLSFPIGFIPKSAGQVTFRAEVSVDDCWPLPISIVVRNRDGSIPVSE